MSVHVVYNIFKAVAIKECLRCTSVWQFSPILTRKNPVFENPLPVPVIKTEKARAKVFVWFGNSYCLSPSVLEPGQNL